MDRRMADALDRHITGNYGEDQFKNDQDFWKMGDKLVRSGEKGDVYILARTVDHKNKRLLHFQFISLTSGNRYSDTVISRKIKKGVDSITITLDEVLDLLENEFYDDNLDELEKCHVWGPEW